MILWYRTCPLIHLNYFYFLHLAARSMRVMNTGAFVA